MNKSQLREIIRGIVFRKLTEAEDNPIEPTLPKDNVDADNKEVDPKKQAEIAAIQKNLDAEKAKLQQTVGKIADLDAKIANAKRPLDMKKRNLEKKVGQLTDKLKKAQEG